MHSVPGRDGVGVVAEKGGGSLWRQRVARHCAAVVVAMESGLFGSVSDNGQAEVEVIWARAYLEIRNLIPSAAFDYDQT